MVFWCNQSHGKMVFYPFPESPSICCRDLGPACLSQQAWKLAQKERLACANYILISGNVLANQASIAILEHIALLCRLQTVAPACGSKNVPGTSLDAGCTALHHSFLWWHAWPPRWKQTDAPWLTERRDGQVGLPGTLMIPFHLMLRRTPTSIGIRYTTREGAGSMSHHTWLKT